MPQISEQERILSAVAPFYLTIRRRTCDWLAGSSIIK
jgi:hypothetical protein